MPSSRYVYADANQAVGSMTNRRRSQRIRRRTLENATSNDLDDDPDVTVLEQHGDDEGVLLSDEENAPPSNSDAAMDMDEKCYSDGDDPNGKRRNDTGRSMEIRGGAEGILSNDPLTSSTMKSTPFSVIRARNAKKNSRVSAKERLRRFADRFESDESDNDDIADTSEREFMRDVARKRAQREAVLAESQQQQDRQQHQSFASSSLNESFESQQQRQSTRQTRQDESDATNRIGNIRAMSSNNQSLSESFAATQPWEKELDGLPFYQRNDPEHNQHKSNHEETQSSTNNAQSQIQRGQRQDDQSNHQAKESHTNVGSQLNRIAYHGASSSHHQSFSEPFAATHLPLEKKSGPLPSFEINAPKKVPHRQEHNGNSSNLSTSDSQLRNQWSRLEEDQSNRMDQAPSNNSQLNNYSNISSHQQNLQRNHDNSESNHDYNSSSRSALNPYIRKPPPPPFKSSAASENIKSRQQAEMSGKASNRSRGDDNTINYSSSREDTWREEAFRSSLIDLLGSFPAKFFDYQDDNKMFIFAIENIDDESPHSTTQRSASSQLNRKRLFDAASRSLARLAIASRHATRKDFSRNNDSRASGGSHDDGESPDFNPPSPRSLPAYMSVMNVHDDSSPGSGTYWGAGNSSAMLSSSREVFSGQSVHGRNARTVRLSKVPQGNIIPSSNPLSSWSSEELAFGSLVVAAQVCHEATFDAIVEGKHRPPSSEAESRRVAGDGRNEQRPEVLTTLVESCLGFLATAFACLESDFVYSVLKSTLKSQSTVFDALSQFAPVSSYDKSSGEVCTVSALSLLALSRGFEAAITVARTTSLDPSSTCIAYSSPQKYCGMHTNVFIDTGIHEGGVGWSSALGRDLGLKLEDHQSSRPRHMHLSKIAGCAYDIILDYNPMIVDDGAHSSHGMLRRDDWGDKKRGVSRCSHYIDTQDGTGLMDAVACHQPSVVKDRLYAANVEFLASMIRAGIVSDWLTNATAATHESSNSDDLDCVRTVDKLCQKLFYVIETVSRKRCSTNQKSATPDPGDIEAVCAASLTLLILTLPRHVNQSEPSSLSISFRQMGNSTGSIDDLLHSPLVRRIVEMALSWQDPGSSRGDRKEENSDTKTQATSNAMYILGDICMIGGSSLISSHFSQRLEGFLQTIMNSISDRGRTGTADHYFDDLNIDSCLLFLVQLHTGSPITVRTFLRNFMDNGCKFVGGLLHLVTSESFSVSSCASSLLRVLVDGNPADRTKDRLSEMMLNSFDNENVGSHFEDALRQLLESTYTSLSCNRPNFSIRSYPRICFLGDVLGVCILTTSASEIFASSMSDEVLNLLGVVIECDPQHDQIIDTLSGSAKMSFVNLFASFSTKVISNDKSGALILAQQRRVKETLMCAPGHLSVLEAAMAQGTSADMTHRSLKLQSSLMSLSDERFLAHTLTRSRDSVAKKERILKDKLRELAARYQKSELDCDGLTDSLRDQRLAYERQLEWTRSEYRTASKNASEILVYERKIAEDRYTEECKARKKCERENEQLTHDCFSYKLRIKELEEILGHERSSRQEFESALGSCKDELSTTSKELERISSVCHDLQEKLSVSESKVLHLTAINEESEASLENICSKLIKLATIYQVKEHEMDKYKAELRSAVNTANSHADTAIQKYESSKQENNRLRAKLEEVTAELGGITARRADVQRMRKNAPVAYLNQLHKDSAVPQRITLQEAGKRRSPRRQGKN
ncbi:hypothetical protein ACHAW5_002164 [Stephanodiscus triporus]|uniref:Uncharacterized protein n=1 Tax=Stephanodiscus triporus TaxID=2934178 RepID=A0ABD3Q485_9STRA